LAAKTSIAQVTLEYFLHPPHAFGHAFFGIAERDSEKAFCFLAERDSGNGNYPILQAFLGDLEIVA
jgi:hypothetical protein